MSLKLFNAELDRFLRTTEPEVLCITGKWGVGKTFAWLDRFGTAQKTKSIGLERHSYVSLFGRNSLEDVRTAIAENTKDTSDLNLRPDMDSMTAVINKLTPIASSISKVASFIPGATNHVANLNRALFLTIRKQIVCLDDLERSGAGLEMKTILGLAVSLKDERECKVVILLNQDALKGDKEKDFAEQLEKVADTVISFEPTAKEAADLAVRGTSDADRWLSDDIQRLGIVNIRVIRKAQRACARALEFMPTADDRVRKQVVHTIVLASYAKFQPEEAPPLALLKKFEHFSDYLGNRRSTEPDPNAKHKSTLRSYGFGSADDLDKLLIQGIERGMFEVDAVLASAETLSQKLRASDKSQAYMDSWKAFHDSFDDNLDEVLDGMYDGLVSNLDFVNAPNLSATITFLKEMGRPEQAQKALDVFMDQREASPAFWDLSQQHFGADVTDLDVRAAFAKKLEAVTTQPNPAGVLKRISEQSGWNPEDIAHLATLTAMEYVSIFKSLRGNELDKAVRAGLQFRDIANADDDMKRTVAAVEAALQIIAAESPLNARRIRRFGVHEQPTAVSSPDKGEAGGLLPDGEG